MQFDRLLATLGVDDATLAPSEREELDRDGFTTQPGALDREQVAGLRELCYRIVATESVPPDADGGSCHRIHHLFDRSPLFDVVWSHPRILAAIRHVVRGEFRPTALNYRSPIGGGGLQHLHSDNTWTTDGRYAYAQAIIPLVDLTEHNGPPRFVPGTHRLRHRSPADEMADVHAPHPREVRPLVAAGTAIIFNGTLWHSGTRNIGSEPRPVLHIGFGLRDPDNPGDGKTRPFIRAKTYERLAPAMRCFLDAAVIEPGTFAYTYEDETIKPFRDLANPAAFALPAAPAMS
jgi:hypothetical protein